MFRKGAGSGDIAPNVSEVSWHLLDQDRDTLITREARGPFIPQQYSMFFDSVTLIVTAYSLRNTGYKGVIFSTLGESGESATR